ncbi:hypothetical protein MARPO_0010s0204 [Marchantia polymorpha]|uniref:Uncharacterized protein n=1 Tax=Marchantia polymorpha TaxID=3197 RepID=A0A2R6XL74_MARPO|nr:hypothetical protein MARPO_0010s0204 [Marchantia polymorpha]|eukprot:PTQ46842.1 hypothetical protein MARPO_0010s0204 [Marchantia polymorpha]
MNRAELERMMMIKKLAPALDGWVGLSFSRELNGLAASSVTMRAQSTGIPNPNGCTETSSSTRARRVVQLTALCLPQQRSCKDTSNFRGSHKSSSNNSSNRPPRNRLNSRTSKLGRLQGHARGKAPDLELPLMACSPRREEENA